MHDSVQGDANTTSITDQLLGFGTNGDEDGTKTIRWNEANLSAVLRFNFRRQVNVPVNPFIVDRPDYNVTAVSHYTNDPTYAAMPGYDADAYPDGTDDNASGKALFVYGRAHAPRYRVDCTTTSCTSQPLIVYYEFYSDDHNSTILDLRRNTTYMGAGADQRSKDSFSWFQNMLHSAPDDGTVQSTQQKNGGLAVDTGTYVQSPGRTSMVYSYNGTEGYPYKATIEINASKWLIYNRFNPNAQLNEFELEFNNKGTQLAPANAGGFTGEDNASINSSRRIQW